MSKRREQQPWRNRIVRYSEEAPDQLLANPRNWRTHPGSQAEALRGVLGDVGYVQSVIVNERTGFLVDGHLRVQEALKAGQASIPVVWVDLSEAEEALVLATLDPVAALAGTDPAKLDDLLRDVSTDSAAVQAMLDTLATEAGVVEAAPIDPNDLWKGMPEFESEDQTGIRCVVHFETEEDKAAFERLVGQKIPKNTKSIWYPQKAWADQEAYRYASE